MHSRVAMLVLISTLHQAVLNLNFSNIVFIIVSQRDPHNAAIAKRLKQDIINQTQIFDKGETQVHLTHEDFPVPGSWTILPLLRPILNMYKNSDVRWVLFLEPHTAVRYALLVESLAAADDNADTQWIGHPLTDKKPTLVHHLAYYEASDIGWGLDSPYPYSASGFAMKLELINAFLLQLSTTRQRPGKSNLCSIDPFYGLAKLIYGNSSDPGPMLSPDLSFCIVPADNCATYPKTFDVCGSPISEHSIFFAVKTWSGYHNRVKVIKKTWGRHVTNLLFYSDETDTTLPSIDTGVPNAKTGHCIKTMTILKMAVDRVRNMPHVQWIFLSDDDTILGVQRLIEILSCYRGGSHFTALGERYGYGYERNATSITEGYDYLTTGAGVALSVAAAAAFSNCSCPFLIYEDDMALGECAKLRNYTLTHSPLFHQRQPEDYPRETLLSDRPVSFHHYSENPFQVYATWFQHDDLAMRQRRKEEL